LRRFRGRKGLDQFVGWFVKQTNRFGETLKEQPPFIILDDP
jgi:hypothetical protein